MTSDTSNPLLQLLNTRFGFPEFRPHQEKVCQTVFEGRDVLVVMPTGAGKSLCFQLPGIARGGATIVISPLLALIEDQVEKLNQQNFKSDRIHSGRKREDSRQVCSDYLAGRLDFLFIAPERLSVPGFLELLAKRPPSLIAIDEAHCISQWGHDFRPDYRLLGERLHLLRPTPIVALTATATPLVQNDICHQLRLKDPIRWIHGFRRENIGIHVVELNPSFRTPAIQKLFAKPERFPAIIYAPTRKVAEQLFTEFQSQFKTGIYHAGMTPTEREKNQLLFSSGQLDIIVATVAFGMGIDKANIRTVIHFALPGSVEGYYQEIGRAGRDGKPSQAILLQSFSDQRTHDFFFERDYPEASVLKKIFVKLGPQKISKEGLKEELSMDSEIFDKALEKLWIHKGASIDFEENIAIGNPEWEKSYLAQRQHKQKQAVQMLSFAQSSQCRMLTLVKHFGDQNDNDQACGICDFCLPESSYRDEFQSSRALTQPEKIKITQIMAILTSSDYQAAGRLFQELAASNPTLQRREFEDLLQVLARAKWISVAQENYQKNGEQLSYRKISLTSTGKKANSATLEQLQITEAAQSKKNRKKTPAVLQKREMTSEERTITEYRVSKIKAWRSSEAKKREIPAFCVFSDRVLFALCETLPKTESELLQVKGMGPKLCGLYGKDLLRLLRDFS